jgi:hypothetical protein
MEFLAFLSNIGVNLKEVALFGVCLGLIGLIWRLFTLQFKDTGITALTAAVASQGAIQETTCENQRAILETQKDILYLLGQLATAPPKRPRRKVND